MEQRKKHIKKLKSIIEKDSEYIYTGSWRSRALHLCDIADICQVFEYINYDGKEIPMEEHIHVDSKEIFYQLVGKTTFSDGTILSSGEFKVIEPNKKHGATIHRGGKGILIVHPPELEYAMGE